MSLQRRFIDDDQMVQALPPNCTDDPLDIRTLLRRSGRSQHFLNAKLLQLLRETRTEDPVPVAKQILRGSAPWESLPQLLGCPFGVQGRNREFFTVAY